MSAVLERQDKVRMIQGGRLLATEIERLVYLAESEPDPVRRQQLLVIADRLSKHGEDMANLTLKLVHQ